MKKFNVKFLSTPGLLLVLAFGSLGAQNHFDVNLAHNWNLLDRDIEVSVEHFKGKIGVKAGFNYFQNTAQESLTWERPYAETFGQHIGFHAAFLYRIQLDDSNVELSPFFKAGFFYLSTKQQIGENNAVVSPAFFRPVTSIGLQLKTKLSGRLMLFGSLEAGAIWDAGGSPYIYPHDKLPHLYGASTGGAVGLSWRIKK